eukprot:5948449-Pyramimonas_sp.AAC.1
MPDPGHRSGDVFRSSDARFERPRAFALAGFGREVGSGQRRATVQSSAFSVDARAPGSSSARARRWRGGASGRKSAPFFKQSERARAWLRA